MKRIALLLGCCWITCLGFSQQKGNDNLNSQMIASSILAKTSAAKPEIFINPDPISGPHFSLQLHNLAKGKYQVLLFDKEGSKYLVKTINFDGGSATQVLDLPKKAGNGTYILQVISKTARFVKKVTVQ